MTLRHGDIVLVPFPFTDLKAIKRRPAVVLSSTIYNADSRDVLVCALTSNVANASRSVLVTNRDLSEGKLVATSRVKADKVVTLQQTLAAKVVARLRPAVLQQVYRELLAVLPDEARP